MRWLFATLCERQSMVSGPTRLTSALHLPRSIHTCHYAQRTASAGQTFETLTWVQHS